MVKDIDFLRPFALFCIILTGCGRGKSEDVHPSDPDVPQNVSLSSEVDSYPFSNPTCQEQQGNDLKLGSVQLDHWISGTLTHESLDLTQQNIFMSPTRSDHVQEILVGTIFRRFCDTNTVPYPRCGDKNHSEELGWRSITWGKPLHICDSHFDAKSNTAEQLGLSGITAIESAAAKLTAFLPDLKSLQKLSVLVAPKFESYWTPWKADGKDTAFEEILSDNLAYFAPSKSTPPFIAIFPKRTSSPVPISLWESEFVIAHEFGHHVEHTLGLDHFNESRSLMRSAVSEGFADLMAFASMDTKDHSILGIPCFGTDRAPNQATFASGAVKSIPNDLIKDSALSAGVAFNSGFATNNCVGTRPGTAHGLGAVFAHWVWDFSTLSPNYSENKGRSLALLAAEWMRQVDKNLGAGTTSNKSDLKIIAKALETSVTALFPKNSRPMSDDVRRLVQQKMNEAFPALTNETWFVTK